MQFLKPRIRPLSQPCWPLNDYVDIVLLDDRVSPGLPPAALKGFFGRDTSRLMQIGGFPTNTQCIFW